MKAIGIAAALMYLLATTFAPLAHAQADEAGAVAQHLMVRSGMSEQLKGFSAQIDAEIRQNATNAEPYMVAALSDAAQTAFRADVLLADIAARVVKKLTVADMKAALVWLETEPGKRITLAEEHASATLDLQRLGQYVESLKAKPLPAKRTALITGLVSATNAVRAAAATHESIAFGVAIGMDSLQPKERRLGEAVLRGRLRQIMPPDALQSALAQQLPVIFAYTYRDVSDDDLSGYVAFLKGVAGKRYQDALTGAFIEGVGQASVRVGELVGQRERQTSM